MTIRRIEIEVTVDPLPVKLYTLERTRSMGNSLGSTNNIPLEPTTVEVSDFLGLIRELTSLPRGTWIFRGQTENWPLSSTLQRAIVEADLSLATAGGLELQMVRDFRRRYRDENAGEVLSDTLYCLATMQHYGAPTRLLDFTYSFYVAAYFALRSRGATPNIWCIFSDWAAPPPGSKRETLRRRAYDSNRGDSTFVPLYFSDPERFVSTANPFRLNDRAVAQQSVFLVPGDVTATFHANMAAISGWNDRSNVLKIDLAFTNDARLDALSHLNRMNVTAATLFPGLGGFAESLHQRILLYRYMANRNVGIGGPEEPFL